MSALNCTEKRVRVRFRGLGLGLGLVQIIFKELIVVVQACRGGTRGTSVQCQRYSSSGRESPV